MPNAFAIDLKDDEKTEFLRACVESGMRETRCGLCGVRLFTRGDVDLCPDCRNG